MHPRLVTEADLQRPVYVVWELTLRCDHACAHCGSRAGNFQRPRELDRAEALEICDTLARLGTREVTLVGGEAYLSPLCLPVIERLTERGVRVTMQTGGLGFNARRATQLRGAGLSAVGFSIDGPADVHDVLRARPGSWKAATSGVKAAKAAGLVVTSNSQVNRLNAHRLEETAAFLHALGIAAWRCQLTVPMGRAADRPEWILEPWRVPEVIDTLAELQIRYANRGLSEGLPHARLFNVSIGNNLGYYGPHEVLLRSAPGMAAMTWQGCQAGVFSMGIESDGTIKGCPSLPTAPYAGGNVRDLPLEAIWENAPEVAFRRRSSREELWGFCDTCYFADTCQGGCSFTAHCTLGRRGNNPFCYHRATTLHSQGLRERLVHRERAAGEPYDFGRFDVVTEPFSADS